MSHTATRERVGPIAVLGATGTIGRHVVAGLADTVFDARAIVRDPSRADVPLPSVHGDLNHPASVRDALDGVERLLLLTPHGPDQDLQERAVVDAAIEAGVRRIVKISGTAPSLGPNGVTPTAVAHWRSERLIEASGLAWTFLRPSFVMQNLLDLPLTAGFLLAPLGRGPIAMIDARDVAACAVVALTDDHVAGAWHLTGPAGVTCKEAAHLLGARGYVSVPPKLTVRAMRRRGASTREVEHAIRMARFFASGADGSPTDCVLHIVGRKPRSLEQFFKDEKGA